MKKSFFLKSLILPTAFVFVTLISFSACNNSGKQSIPDKTKASSDNSDSKIPTVRIAYVNLDTLENDYIYFKKSKEEFASRQASIKASLESSAENFQNEYATFQKKAQSGMMSQTEGEAAQKKLGKMQEELENKRDNLTSKLVKDQEAFTKKLQSQLDSFLTEYNKDKHYDYILSYMENGNILLANPDYDITNDVVAAMNKAYNKNHSENSKKSTK